MPLIVRLPDGRQAGEVAAGLVELVDLYPTLVDLSNLPQPAHALEGASLRPLLDDPDLRWKAAVFSESILEGFHGRTLRTPRYRYTEWTPVEAPGTEPERELYDHENDPFEYENLASDPAHRALVDELSEHLSRRVAGGAAGVGLTPRPFCRWPEPGRTVGTAAAAVGARPVVGKNRFAFDGFWPSSERPHRASQFYLEEVLTQACRRHSSGSPCTSGTRHASCPRARQRWAPRRRDLRRRRGARSLAHGSRPYVAGFIFHPNRGGALIAIDRIRRWLAHVNVPRGVDHEDVDFEAGVRELVGLDAPMAPAKVDGSYPIPSSRA